MSKKVLVNKLKDYVVDCINTMKIGDKIIFTEKEAPLSKDKRITLIKTDENRFAIEQNGVDDFKFSNLDFNGVIDHMMELQVEEFTTAEVLYTHKD